MRSWTRVNASPTSHASSFSPTDKLSPTDFFPAGFNLSVGIFKEKNKTMQFGSQSEVGKIKRLLLKHPKQVFIDHENILRQWEALNYFGAPDFEKALQEYEQFVNLLRQHIAEISFLPSSDHTGLDFIYVHDPVLVTKLLPVPFREWLLTRSIKLIEVPDSEYETMACNILAVAPQKCMMLSGNHRTKALLEAEGVEVWEYKEEEISLKDAGGPTCLTRPLVRE